MLLDPGSSGYITLHVAVKTERKMVEMVAIAEEKREREREREEAFGNMPSRKSYPCHPGDSTQAGEGRRENWKIIITNPPTNETTSWSVSGKGR